MIAVVLISILSMVAVGYYRDNVISSNLTEGRSALQSAAGVLEKCRARYGRYDHASCNYANFVTESNYYGITSAIAGTSFTLTATPVPGGPQANDADCTTLTLTSTGIQGATGADTSQCW